MWLILDGDFYNLDHFKSLGFVDIQFHPDSPLFYRSFTGIELDPECRISMSKKRAEYVLDKIADGLKDGFRIIEIRKGEGE